MEWRTAWTAERAREVIAGWEESGQSGNEYARSIGVVPQRLFWWRRRLAERDAPAKAGLVPVTVGRVAAEPALVVTTVAGARIEIHEVDATTAAWVAAVLNGERS